MAGLVLVIGVFVASGCHRDDRDAVLAPQYGADFIPLATGHYVDYRVDTLNQNLLPVPTETTGSFMERHIVRDTAEKTSLQIAVHIEVYQRLDSISPWRLHRTDIAFLRFDGAYVIQENGVLTQYLTLPFTKGTGWNFNAFNSSNESAYTMRFSQLGMDSVALFSGVLDTNCIDGRQESISYKKGIGLYARSSFKATFVQDPNNPCAFPKSYQTRQTRQWTYLGSGRQ